MNVEDTWDGHMRRAHIDAAQEQHPPASHLQTASLARRAMLICIALVCAWSIVETPWELSPTDGLARFVALMLAKCLLLAVGAAAFFGLRYARALLAFVCASSVFAVASTLPFEYTISHELFMLSVVECACKVALVISFAIWYVKRH